MRLPGFVGPSARERSLNFNAERCINLFPAFGDSGSPKTRNKLLGTPGMRFFAHLNPGPIRALFHQDGRTFAVSGTTLWELLGTGRSINRGTVRADPWPATISSNGDAGEQLFITSGGLGYIYALDTDTLTLITDAAFPSPCAMGLFFDGYFIALNGETGFFHLSELQDGEEWNGLDFGAESQVSDRTIAMVRTHDTLWLFGSKHTAPWYNSGDASFPFRPVQGTLIEQGIAARFSIASLDNRLFWLGADDRGSGIVWAANGYTPVRVSTHAVEYAFSQVPTLANAIAWAYQDEGHLFYVLYLPSAETTWVYDVATNLWHERAMWDTDRMRWVPHLARCYCYAFGKHLVGDRASGAIYHLSMDYYDDDVIGELA
jgi:hypothetical protein